MVFNHILGDFLSIEFYSLVLKVGFMACRALEDDMEE